MCVMSCSNLLHTTIADKNSKTEKAFGDMKRNPRGNAHS